MSNSISSVKRLISLLPIALVVFTAACGGAPAQLAKIATGVAQSTPAKKSAAQTGKPTPLANCQAIMQANMSFGPALAMMVNLSTTTDYKVLTRVDSPFMLDIGKLRANLDTLASLPDPTSAEELLFGKPSDSVAYFRQMVDVTEGDIKSNGNPFRDTSASGQRVIGLDTPWMTKMASFGLAIDKACQGIQLVLDTPVAPNTFNGTKYNIGQTANDGDLRITLDKVTTVAGEGNNLPEHGNRFVVFYATVANTGKTPLSVPVFAFPMVNDAAGKTYPFSPNTIMLSAAHISDLIGVDIPAGGKLSGAVG
ncbi:MAG TPA: DUF4352 domain-containing protein, partial [Anaerolineae bacterium]